MKIVRNLMRTLCILVLFLLTNCQSDTVTEIQQEETLLKESPFKSTLLSKQDIESNNKLSTKMRSLATLQQGSFAESTSSEIYNFTIDATIVKFVENVETNTHSYTFSISRENNTSSVLENVVFSYNETMDDYDASLVTYHFTELQRQEFIATRHVNSSYQITYEPLTVNLSDILGEDSLPCTITYAQYHIPNGSRNSFLYSTNGHIQNDCEHEGANDVPCATYTNIVIYCPPSGSGSSNGTDDNSTNDDSTASTTGGGGDASNGDVNNDEIVVVTSPISIEESIKQSILECINTLSFDNSDTTTIAPEILEQVNLTLREWTAIINYLDENGCSEMAQQAVIDELIEESIKNGIRPPSCEAFEYSNVNSNWQASATMNIIALIGYYDVATGEYNTASVLFPQPIYFEMPIYSAANGGYISNGRAAELTAKALFVAIRRAKAYFLATSATSSQVQAKLWEYIREEMVNGTYVIGGRASFTPPLGYNGGISDYQSYWFLEDNCD